MNPNELRAKRADLIKQATAITEGAKASATDLTDDQTVKIDALLDEGDALEASAVKIEADEARAARLSGASAGLATPGRRADPNQPEAQTLPAVTGGDGRNDLATTTMGFHSFGEQAQAIYAASQPGTMTDPRLMVGAAAQGGSEAVGVDGGFLVAPEFSMNISRHSLEGESLLAQARNDPASGNSMTYPAGETTPWGSNGVRVYWRGEAAAATKTKPALQSRTLRLHELFGLVPMTNELLEDAGTLSSYLFDELATSIRWKTNDAIINGTGSGMPKGIAGHAAEVAVAKETSQTAATIVTANVAKMYARLSSRVRPIWVLNNDALPQIIQLTLGNMPIWTPPAAGLAQRPGGTLLGIPMFLSQTAETVGARGDIRLIDMFQYRALTKARGVDFQTSIHLYFDTGETAFRATFRMDGHPWVNSTITPNKGSNALSPYVALAVRA